MVYLTFFYYSQFRHVRITWIDVSFQWKQERGTTQRPFGIAKLYLRMAIKWALSEMGNLKPTILFALLFASPELSKILHQDQGY